MYTHRPPFIVLGVFVLLALTPPVPASAQRHLPGDEDLRHMLRYIVEDREAPGVVLGVLDDPVSRYLPDHVAMPSFEGREITLLDLALHRSALPGTPTDLGNVGRRSTGVSYTVEDAYAFLSDYELPRAPAAGWRCS